MTQTIYDLSRALEPKAGAVRIAAGPVVLALLTIYLCATSLEDSWARTSLSAALLLCSAFGIWMKADGLKTGSLGYTVELIVHACFAVAILSAVANAVSPPGYASDTGFASLAPHWIAAWVDEGVDHLTLFAVILSWLTERTAGSMRAKSTGLGRHTCTAVGFFVTAAVLFGVIRPFL